VPDEGRILLRGEDVTERPPNRRPTNMVFQSYELFPHLTVAENILYGPRLAKVPREEQRRRLGDVIELVNVVGLEGRRASELSGGQQQRVALARALINRPAVLLLDEPLSALDVKLRKRMQIELKTIQEELGTTFVYVTHDQEEALVLSDRVGIMNAGELLQVAPPDEIYHRPSHPFVADFVGTLSTIGVTIASCDGDLARGAPAPGQVVTLRADDVRPGQAVRVGIRPERLRVVAGEAADRADAATSSVRGTIATVALLGSITQLHVDAPGVGRLICHQLTDPVGSRLAPGHEVTVEWSADASILLRDDPTEIAS